MLRRSIPACAGEPDEDTAGGRGITVYPRLCGGTGRGVEGFYDSEGLSPPVRGNHPAGHKVFVNQRSIPACAGEPRLGYRSAGR